MIEYLYDAIRATIGDDIEVTATILGSDGEPMDEGCHMMIYDGEDMVFDTVGSCFEDVWTFTIPADVTKTLKGRYKYCICDKDSTDLCFKQPIYFV